MTLRVRSVAGSDSSTLWHFGLGIPLRSGAMGFHRKWDQAGKEPLDGFTWTRAQAFRLGPHADARKRHHSDFADETSGAAGYFKVRFVGEFGARRMQRLPFWEDYVLKLKTFALLASAAGCSRADRRRPAGKTIAVSWKTFQEER